MSIRIDYNEHLPYISKYSADTIKDHSVIFENNNDEPNTDVFTETNKIENTSEQMERNKKRRKSILIGIGVTAVVAAAAIGIAVICKKRNTNIEKALLKKVQDTSQGPIAINRSSMSPIKFSNEGLNPEKMGVVLEDGSIQFKNQEAAIEYGIKRCSASVKGPKPFERNILIRDSAVVAEANGSESQVAVDWLEAAISDIDIHSHPDTYARGITTALSQQDYESFIDSQFLKKMIAVNSKGEYYQMTKIPGFNYGKIKSDMAGDIFSDFNIKILRTMFGENDAPKEAVDALEKCIMRKDKDFYYNEFVPKYILPASESKYIVDASHTYWVKYAEELGVRVKTNFSNFVKTNNT